MVAKLGQGGVLYEAEVDANNWMGALRAAREGMSERGSVPAGVSCSIDGDGVATVLDPVSRRRFVLQPLAATAVDDSAPSVAAAAPVAASSAPAVSSATPGKAKRFETVALEPAQLAAARPAVQVVSAPAPAPAPIPAPAPVPAAPAPVAAPRPVPAPAPPAEPIAAPVRAESSPAAAAAPKKKRFETVAFIDGAPAPGAAIPIGDVRPKNDQPIAPPPAVGPVARSEPPASGPPQLELVYTRDAEPTPNNPLLYRERAYVVGRGVTLTEAETVLHEKLAELQAELATRPRGKMLNLALFDHHWRDAPDRPPVVSMQWRDWRGDVVVDYPAAARLSSLPPPPPPGAHDDRLAEVFEGLEELGRLTTAADALDFGVKLLDHIVPADAISGCLYDINTDELRFVAVTGPGAADLQGQAVQRSAGLFALALRSEGQATLVRDVLVEPAFNPSIDSRPGLDAQNVLLRPLVHERQLVGMLQLINRRAAGTTDAADVNIVSYVAERLAEVVLALRRRGSRPPPKRA